MFNSKIHNPEIAKNSYLKNAVIEKVDTAGELLFSDLENSTPIIPEIGRMWFNIESGQFKFVNKNDSTVFIDEFLSRTDKRLQTIESEINFKNTVQIFNDDDSIQLKIDSINKSLDIDNSNIVSVKTSEINFNSPLMTLSDGVNNKIEANNSTDNLKINYETMDITGSNISYDIDSKISISDNSTTKLTLDNLNDSFTLSYATVGINSTDTNFNISKTFVITDGTNNKIEIDNETDNLNINYSNSTVNGDMSVNGNMIISGDLTVGGQTSKIDIKSEHMTVSDNIITLNSNLTETDDPRLASAIVDGEDVDHNAGIEINRGSEGKLKLIQWTESSDTTTDETLKEGKAKISIWNYEADTPAYELHQIIDAYTLGRQIENVSGSSWVGYDGKQGINYKNAILNGVTDEEASKYSFKIDNDKLDNVIDTIVEKLDADSYEKYNNVRVGETTVAGKSFKITHNLGTVFVDVKIQREDNGKWYFDILPIEIIDENTIKIESSENIKIRYMISAIVGFDINQSTDIVIS